MSLTDLYIRYFFWRDMGDSNRANYYLLRIKEIENKK